MEKINIEKEYICKMCEFRTKNLDEIKEHVLKYHNVIEKCFYESVITRVSFDADKIRDMILNELSKRNMINAVDVYCRLNRTYTFFVDLVISIEKRYINRATDWIYIMETILDVYEKLGFDRDDVKIDFNSVVYDFEYNMDAVGFAVRLQNHIKFKE